MVQDPFRGQTDEEASEYVRILYHGDPGKAKSTNALAAANLGHVVLIDSENRYKPNALRRRGINTKNIERFSQCDYKFLSQLADHLQQRAEAGNAPFAVVIDSLPETHRLLLEDIVDKAVTSNAARGMDRDDYKVHLEDHGDVGEQMRRLLRRYHSLPCHLIMTSISKRDTNEEGELFVAPVLSNSVYRDVMLITDAVVYCMTEDIEIDGKIEQQYLGICRPGTKYVAKDSYGLLPPRLVDPTFPRVLSYLNEDLTTRTDDVQREAAKKRKQSTLISTEK